jgi:hypothetical protein
MPVLLTVPPKDIVAMPLASSPNFGATPVKVVAFKAGLPDRPNFANALCFDILKTLLFKFDCRYQSSQWLELPLIKFANTRF